MCVCGILYAHMDKKNYKWLMLTFLFGAYFLEQATRQVYSATLPQIKLDFLGLGVTDALLGSVGTVFTIVFGLCLVGSGLASDLFGRKRVLLIGVVLYSLGAIGSGFAQSVGFLMISYGVINAIGQCCIAPPCYSLISQYHVATRSTAMSIFQSAVYLGIILGSVSAGVMASWGAGRWRWAFWTVGALGLLWALVMVFGLHSETQRGVDGCTEEKATVREAFLALIRKPTAILIAFSFGMFIYVSTGIRIWVTTFMVRTFEGVSLAGAALHSVFWQYLGAVIGCNVMARLLDQWGKKRPRIRLEISAIGLLLCIIPIIFIARASTFVGCAVALGVHGLTMGVYEAGHYPAMFDCIAPRYRSATTGLTGCMAFVMGSMAPLVLGWISDRSSMREAMMSLGWFYLAGALILIPAILWYFRIDFIPNQEELR